MKATETHYDVIMIGSGMGALATASILTQLHNKRVLILEQHFKIGGFTHTFHRKGKFEWDVGLHYVGKMDKGQTYRKVMDFVTGGAVDWVAMPDVFDRIIFPNFTFDIRAGRSNFKADLLACFPDECVAIHRYFHDIQQADNWINRYMVTQSMPGSMRFAARLIRRWGAKLALTTVGEYLDQHFTDEKLKTLLAAQWGLYGLPPKVGAFAAHAALINHYADGGWYPIGGASVIAEAVVSILRRQGGQVLVNHRVDEIILESGAATGVRTTQKKGKQGLLRTFYAPIVISDAGAYATYTKLLPKSLHLPFEQEIRQFPMGPASVTLYLALKEDPARFGLKGENYWIFADDDHDKLYAQRNLLLHDQVSLAYVSFPSAKNPRSKGHTAEIVAFMDTEPFARWSQTHWQNRGAEYQKVKDQIAETLITFVEQSLPGFASNVQFYELSTPLTTETFTGHRGGAIYGLPLVKEKFAADWLGPYTPIHNLYLTGSDAGLFGIVGAMMSGTIAAAAIMKRPWNMMTILQQAKRMSTG